MTKLTTFYLMKVNSSLLHQRDSYPKKMALLEMENKNNLDEIHQLRAGGFTPSSFLVFSWSKYQHIHLHIRRISRGHGA